MTSTTATGAPIPADPAGPGTPAAATTSEAPPASEVELLIGGMTCASCAARVEKKLNRMDGVTATVNYATEKARIAYPAGTEVADLIATVVKTGYTAEEPAPRRRPPPRRRRHRTGRTGRAPRRRTPGSPPCASG